MSDRCVRCRAAGCVDRELCLLVSEVNSAGNALDAWNDGAVAGALLAGVELDVWEDNLHRRYNAARFALRDYRS